MKSISLKIAAILCVMTMIACNNSKDEALNEGRPAPVPLDSLLVPKGQAMVNIAYFDSLSSKKLSDIPIKAYTIRSQELLVAMGLDSSLISKVIYNNIRVYLAYQPTGEKQGTPGYKLYIVPVIGANLDAYPPIGGKDVMLDKNGKGIKPELLGNYADGDQYVLDLNTPCPNTCAINGDLLTKKISH